MLYKNVYAYVLILVCLLVLKFGTSYFVFFKKNSTASNILHLSLLLVFGYHFITSILISILLSISMIIFAINLSFIETVI